MNGKMKNSKMWYIIIALCTIDLILLYTNKAKDDVIQNNMNEIAILKNNDNNSISAYFKNVGMDLPMHYHVFKICRNEYENN
jgi:sialic acid synthase SpsE